MLHIPRVLFLLLQSADHSVCELVLMGNSLADSSSGHNLSEAAVAGCAIVMGPYGPAGGHMAEELNSAAVAAAEEAAAAVRSTGGSVDMLAGCAEHQVKPTWQHDESMLSGARVGPVDMLELLCRSRKYHCESDGVVPVHMAGLSITFESRLSA
jgi:hypothetical protein